MIRHAPARCLVWTLGCTLWLILAYSGFKYLSNQEYEHTAPFVAARVLPPNSRLVESDLKPNPALPTWQASPRTARVTGKYLIAASSREINKAVWMHELRDQPEVDRQSQARLKLVPLKEQPELARMLNAGHRVSLCAKVCVPDVLVEFVWCMESDSCFAAIALNAEQEPTFDTDDTPRVFLQR